MKTSILKIKRFIFILFFTTLGAFITIVVKKYSTFTISNELDLPDILSLVATILLTYYIGTVLDKNKNNERVSKDTMIQYYKEFEANLKERIRNLYNTENVTIMEISSVFKIARIKLYKLNKFAVEKELIGAHNQLYDDIFQEVTMIWKFCTDGRNITEPRNRDEIELYLIRVEMLIYELVFEINNL